jgi:hypothetical protein
MTFKTILVATVIASAATVSNAAIIDQTLTETYTETGQTLSYDFVGLGQAVGNEVSLTIKPIAGAVTGLDLAGAENEFFNLIVDGTDFGSFSCDGNTGSTIIPVNNGNVVDCDFTLTLSTANFGYDFNANVNDGALEVLLAFSNGSNDFGDDDQVSVRLNYETVAAVPLPAGGLLLLTGLGGVAALKRRKKTAA